MAALALWDRLQTRIRGTPAQRMRRRLLRMMPKGGECVEVGVWRGDFSAAILAATRPRRLHLVDPWRHQPGIEYADAWYGGKSNQEAMDATLDHVKGRFADEIGAGRVVIHRMDSVDAARHFDDASLDWAYIDGNHRYEFVKADLESYLPKLRSGGYLCGDDYGEGGWWEGGVKKAVDEFILEAPVEPVLIQDTQFILRKQ